MAGHNYCILDLEVLLLVDSPNSNTAVLDVGGRSASLV